MKEKLKRMIEVFDELINHQHFEKLETLIKEHHKSGIIFCGVGKNFYIAEKITKTYISLGFNVKTLDPIHALHGDLGMLNNELIIFISKSGTTQELVDLIQYINSIKQKKIINPTTFGLFLKNCETKHILDYCIYSDMEIQEFDSKNLIPTLSINTIQMMLDYVGTQVFEQIPECVERYKFNHPSGNIGKFFKD